MTTQSIDVRATQILFYALLAHLAERKSIQNKSLKFFVTCNMQIFIKRTKSKRYTAAMVTRWFLLLKSVYRTHNLTFLVTEMFESVKPPQTFCFTPTAGDFRDPHRTLSTLDNNPLRHSSDMNWLPFNITQMITLNEWLYINLIPYIYS